MNNETFNTPNQELWLLIPIQNGIAKDSCSTFKAEGFQTRCFGQTKLVGLLVEVLKLLVNDATAALAQNV